MAPFMSAQPEQEAPPSAPAEPAEPEFDEEELEEAIQLSMMDPRKVRNPWKKLT